MDRVVDYLGDRLRGREIPQDLRRLVELELDGVLRGRGSVPPFGEVRVLAPGERHDLESQQARPDDDAGTLANMRAIDEVLQHVAVVVDGFNGDLFGYWLHPDEPPAGPPAIVKLDTEGTFSTLEGATLVEAMVFDWLAGDELTARIVEFCERHAIPLAARSLGEWREPSTVVSPAALHDDLFQRYRPASPRPAPTELVGLRITDPPLAALMARLGFPDPAAAVRAADDGRREVRLASPVARVNLTLYQDEEGTWWLFSAKYRPSTPDRPLEVPLPHGFSLAEDRQAMHARFGPPDQTAILPIDIWKFGGMVAYVLFRDEQQPSFIEFYAADVERRS
jgi:hypothetical protein